MDSISTLNQVMTLLRQQLASTKRTGDQAATSRKTSANSSNSISALAGVGIDESIRDRIAALREDGVDDPQQFKRVVVELLLHGEFGADQRNEAQFQQMVDYVQQCFADDADCDALIEQFLVQSRHPR